MTGRLHFADAGEAADLAAFLARLIHYDKAAAVRLQAAGDTLAVFGRPPSFEVLAIRTARLAEPYEHGPDTALDVTVSAGEFLESVGEASRSVPAAGAATVPEAVTGPPWAGVLPPRGGWRQEPGLPAPEAVRDLVRIAVTEFRARVEELPAERRVRAELDRVGKEIWSRTIGATGLPVRAAHAAQSLGFLRGDALTLLSSGAWLRLRTAYGSVAVRRSGAQGLSVTPA
ncbi:FAD-binding PCMH-type domain-containing protein OS=Streptomyces alboniger OX=132473 GN=CP975_12180 PE=4 SV=1 [Streptomyces alboniger]